MLGWASIWRPKAVRPSRFSRKFLSSAALSVDDVVGLVSRSLCGTVLWVNAPSARVYTRL